MNNSLKTIAKLLMGSAFKSIGFSWHSGKDMRIILTYHRVFNERPRFPYDPAMYVTADTLEMHIEELSRHFDIVPLDAILENPKEKKRLCAITFDDGWADNYTYAFPVLKHFNVPATIFIPVGIIGTERRFWFHEIWEIVGEALNTALERQVIQYFSNLIPTWKPLSLGIDEICGLIAALKYKSAEELDGLICESYHQLGIRKIRPPDTLSWDQAREMGHDGISFGSHGLYHYILPGLPLELKKKEIIDSYQILKRMSVPITPFFCYPNSDWDNEAICCVKDAGYKGAVAGDLGYIDSNSNPFLLNRIGLHEDISNAPSLLWFRMFQAQTARCPR